jgi:hypothetical protein
MYGMKMIKNLVLLLFAIICIALFPIACGNGHKSKQSTKVVSAPSKEKKPIVNVYIENSGSMDGYVKGITEFEQAVYGYLSDLKIAGITDSLNLYYINSKPIQFASVADQAVIEDFINKLEPSSFQKRGGNRGTSDIANILKLVLKETHENNIAVLITDGIFSPGRGRNAQEYLVNQQIGIKGTMADYLKTHPETGIIMYQLFSKFSGIYFNNVDASIPLTETRPYYIWIIGKTKNLVEIRKSVPESKFKGGGLKRMFSIVPANTIIDYAIKQSSGNFEKSRNNPKTEIEDLSRDSRSGKVRFAVNADFTELLLDDYYLTNSGNYNLSLNNYLLAIKKNNDNAKYNHSLYFTSEKVRNGTLSVMLKMAVPKWVEEINDDIGTTALKGKTYGIKYQVNGIYEAYTIKSTDYTEIKITIK